MCEIQISYKNVEFVFENTFESINTKWYNSKKYVFSAI